MSERSQQFQVVLNPEQQYSIWPVDQPLPDGWQPTGRAGSKAACLAFIDEVWRGTRPVDLGERGRHAGDDVTYL